MKKILLGVLVAVLVILASQVDFGEIIDRLSIIKKEDTIKDCPVSIGEKTVALGMSESDVFDIFGTPSDVLLSEYGFYWNIYHENFKNYIQIGIKDGIVVGMYTNSPNLFFETLTVGDKKEKVNELFGESLDGIIKGDTRYLSNGSDNESNSESYKIKGAYVTFFYDTFKNNSLTSVNIIDCDVEESFDMLYAPASDELKKSFEAQSFYVTNATRQNESLTPFLPHEGLKSLAFSHSLDMAENEYFSHTSKNGDSVLDRSQKHNIDFEKIGENLAMGSQNSIYMHELLMNSEGHRKNILAGFTNMGVGVAFAENNTPYLTQNFLK